MLLGLDLRTALSPERPLIRAHGDLLRENRNQGGMRGGEGARKSDRLSFRPSYPCPPVHLQGRRRRCSSTASPPSPTCKHCTRKAMATKTNGDLFAPRAVKSRGGGFLCQMDERGMVWRPCPLSCRVHLASPVSQIGAHVAQSRQVTEREGGRHRAEQADRPMAGVSSSPGQAGQASPSDGGCVRGRVFT